MFEGAARALPARSGELPRSVWEIIETRRYEAVRGICVAGLIISLSSDVTSLLQSGRRAEFAVRTIPFFVVFLGIWILNHHDRNARRSGLLLAVFSAIAMVTVRSFYAPQAAGHFLFFPAAALGAVLLVGFRTGLLLSITTLTGLYVVYFVNIRYQLFPVLIPEDRPATFVAALLMTLVMIFLAGRLLNDVQQEYEASNRMLSEYLDRYRSLLSLLTNDLTASISQLRDAERSQDHERVRQSFKLIQNTLATARRIRSESIPKSD